MTSRNFSTAICCGLLFAMDSRRRLSPFRRSSSLSGNFGFMARSATSFTRSGANSESDDPETEAVSVPTPMST
jgi:hypothetical protein